MGPRIQTTTLTGSRGQGIMKNGRCLSGVACSSKRWTGRLEGGSNNYHPEASTTGTSFKRNFSTGSASLEHALETLRKSTKYIEGANESLSYFKERWVSEENFFPDVPELMRISSLMNGHHCPELMRISSIMNGQYKCISF